MVAEQSPLKNVIDVVRRQKRVTVAGNPVAHWRVCNTTRPAFRSVFEARIRFDLSQQRALVICRKTLHQCHHKGLTLSKNGMRVYQKTYEYMSQRK